MAITAFPDFFPAIRPQVPDAPDELIEQMLQLATREFCLESEAFIRDHAGIDTVVDQKEYTLTIPTGFEILRPFQVRLPTPCSRKTS